MKKVIKYLSDNGSYYDTAEYAKKCDYVYYKNLKEKAIIEGYIALFIPDAKNYSRASRIPFQKELLEAIVKNGYRIVKYD